MSWLGRKDSNLQPLIQNDAQYRGQQCRIGPPRLISELRDAAASEPRRKFGALSPLYIAQGFPGSPAVWARQGSATVVTSSGCPSFEEHEAPRLASMLLSAGVWPSRKFACSLKLTRDGNTTA